MRAANLDKGIKAMDFQLKKTRIIILHYLLENINGLDRSQIRTLADAVLTRRDNQTILGLLKVAGKEDTKGSATTGSGGFFNTAKGYVKSVRNTVSDTVTSVTGKSSKPTREEALLREANNFATTVSDSRFLSELNAAPAHECLNDAVAEAKETAFACLRNQVESLVDGIGQQIFAIQKTDCDKQIQREVTSGEEKELGVLRSEFVHRLEDLTRDRSRSYVHSSFE